MIFLNWVEKYCTELKSSISAISLIFLFPSAMSFLDFSILRRIALHKLFTDSILVQNDCLRHFSDIIEHDLLYNAGCNIMRKTIRLAVPYMITAIKMEKTFPRTAADRRAQLHFIPAICTDEKSRQRMRKPYLCFPAFGDRLSPFLYSVP